MIAPFFALTKNTPANFMSNFSLPQEENIEYRMMPHRTECDSTFFVFSERNLRDK